MSELVSIGPSIWLVEGSVVDFLGFPYPTRMVVVRLSDGGLWLWSPIALDEDLANRVASLGPVRHLVSPNKLHHLFLGDWQARFPEARLFGPASTIRKREDLDFAPAVEDAPPEEWGGEIDVFWLRGSLALDELEFFHVRSGTAIVCDLSQTFEDEFLKAHWRPWQRFVARRWKIIEAWGYAPLEVRATWWRRRAARAVLDRLLAYEPRQVVVAHGACPQTDGRAFLERAFRWAR